MDASPAAPLIGVGVAGVGLVGLLYFLLRAHRQAAATFAQQAGEWREIVAHVKADLLHCETERQRLAVRVDQLEDRLDHLDLDKDQERSHDP